MVPGARTSNPKQHAPFFDVRGLRRHELHRRALHRLGDCLGIAEVILLPLRVGANMLRRHPPGIVAQCPKCATEMMRADAGFHPDHLGQHLGLQHRKRSGSEGIGGLATVEGAIFGLMGLLLAFTISGALQRFDDRRQLVIQEATAATTAYDRLSLFGGDDAHRLQISLKEYVRARIDLYRMAHDFLLVQRAEDFSDQQEKKLLELKNQLWNAAVAACPQPNYRPACALSLPALNSLFEVARLRAGAAEKHPPQIIYFMLFGLGLGCSLLAGFGMATSAGHSWIHMILFAGTLTVALYIVTDMEYPRLGLIRIENFDHFLADAYDQMR